MSIPRLAACALFAAALSACVVAPAPRRAVYVEPAGEVVITDRAPPAPHVEVVPAPPFVGAVWLNGYWGWRGGRHVWVGGRYEAPQPGYRWRPHRWVPYNGRWHLEGGGWARR